MMMELLAQAGDVTTVATEYKGGFALAFAGAGAGIGIGMIGAKAAEAVGRNPTAFGNILTIAIIGMALAEAIAIYALILAFAG
ncbi:MAG: F-type H+-transporting ATPase subunit c [Verrucomicrobiales bacterium]|jgi:F-type H+-transporting ATPase subunit c